MGSCSFCGHAAPVRDLAWFGYRRICKACRPKSWHEELQLAIDYGILPSMPELHGFDLGAWWSFRRTMVGVRI